MNNHQVNQSGNCVIPGCPCRGWSAQEGASVEESNRQRLVASDYHLFRPSQSNAHRCQVCGEYESYLAHGTSSEPPAARGGGEGGVDVVKLLEATRRAKAIGSYWSSTPYLNAVKPETIQSLCVEHQSLVAERERLIQTMSELLVEAEVSCVLWQQSRGFIGTVDDAYRKNLMPAAYSRARHLLANINPQRSTSE